MLLAKAFIAFTAVSQLMETECDYQTAYELLHIKKKLQEHAEFFYQKEQELIAKYGKKNEQGTVELDPKGTFTAAGAEEALAFNREKLELGKVEVHWGDKPKQLPKPEKIRPVTIEALEGIIEFI